MCVCLFRNSSNALSPWTGGHLARAVPRPVPPDAAAAHEEGLVLHPARRRNVFRPQRAQVFRGSAQY